MKPVIITDLDGTLLDHDTYDAAPAEDAIRGAQNAGIPICICSSKTRSEILAYRKKLNIGDPFISENGGAVFIPRRYFAAERTGAAFPETFEIIELGTRYATLVTALCRVRDELGIRIRGFHEVTSGQLADMVGLDPAMAALALEREYDEPFWIEDGSRRDIAAVTDALRKASLHVTRGSRFYHVMGNNDKGKAVDVLAGRFAKHFPNPFVVGLGDSPNDIPMLRRADLPILVKGKSGDYDDETRRSAPGVRLADGIGPAGWNSAVLDLLAHWKRDGLL